MSDALERAARAACVSLGLNPDDDNPGDGLKRWQTELPTIRAALLAFLDGVDSAPAADRAVAEIIVGATDRANPISAAAGRRKFLAALRSLVVKEDGNG